MYYLRGFLALVTIVHYYQLITSMWKTPHQVWYVAKVVQNYNTVHYNMYTGFHSYHSITGRFAGLGHFISILCILINWWLYDGKQLSIGQDKSSPAWRPRTCRRFTIQAQKLIQYCNLNDIFDNNFTYICKQEIVIIASNSL